MTREQKAEKLATELKEQEVAMTKLQINVAENKEASQELEKSLDNLEAVSRKLEEEKG